MFGYATDLRSMTQGRATFSMEFSHYAEVPPDRQRAGAEVGSRAVKQKSVEVG